MAETLYNTSNTTITQTVRALSIMFKFSWKADKKQKFFQQHGVDIALSDWCSVLVWILNRQERRAAKNIQFIPWRKITLVVCCGLWPHGIIFAHFQWLFISVYISVVCAQRTLNKTDGCQYVFQWSLSIM